MSRWPVGRFDLGLLGAMAAAALGLVFGSATTFLVAVVALVFVAYGRASEAPVADIAVERTLSDPSPRPGQEVHVSLAVANVGSTTLSDVRVSDAVPGALPVVGGTPNCCVGLRPDEEVTVEYTIRARRGTATWGDPVVEVRGPGGGAGRRVAVEARSRLSCRTLVSEVTLAPVTMPYTGQVEDDAAGEGVEFHSTREYQHGDPMTRIDWNRYAATDELTTINFRETRAATVLVLVDAGRETNVRAGPDDPTGLGLSAYAGRKLAAALLDDHNRVGVARHTTDCRYLAPGAGHDQTVRVERFFGERPRGDDTDRPADSDDTGSRAARTGTDRQGDGDAAVGRADGGTGSRGTVLEGRDEIGELRKRLPGDTQVLYCSPFLTDRAVTVTERFAAYGHPVTVVSPDVTTGATAGGTVERLERDRRLREVQGRRVRVVDWSPADPLDAALERAAHGWSQ